MSERTAAADSFPASPDVLTEILREGACPKRVRGGGLDAAAMRRPQVRDRPPADLRAL